MMDTILIVIIVAIIALRCGSARIFKHTHFVVDVFGKLLDTGHSKKRWWSVVAMVAVAIVGILVFIVWIFLHPQIFTSVGQTVFGSLGSVDSIKFWGESKVFMALNIVMLAVIAWHLWVSGDFFGMILITGLILLLRATFGI